MTTKSKTADELLAELRLDPEFSAREELGNEQLERTERFSRNEQVQLLSELRNVDVIAETVWDLVNTKNNYPAAIPVLIRHLSLPYSVGVKEGIVRALSVKYAGPEALCELIKEFTRQNDASENSLKWALGNAISAVARSSDADILETFATDRSYGVARDMIISCLPRVIKDKVRLNTILDHLSGDEDVRASVKRAKSIRKK